MSTKQDYFEEFTFESADAGSSLTYPSRASALRKSGHVVLNNTRPCKITELSTSKPGKHGHAKLSITGIDIFTGKKYDHVAPAHSTVEIPKIVKREFLMLDVSQDGFLSLFDADGGDTKDDVKVPAGEVGDKVRKLLEARKEVMVIVQAAMGEEAVIEVKEVKEA